MKAHRHIRMTAGRYDFQRLLAVDRRNQRSSFFKVSFYFYYATTVFCDKTYAMLYGILAVVVAPRRRSSVGTSTHACVDGRYTSNRLDGKDVKNCTS